jgi:glycosyltransferase involved in cell wall biosynthesis
MMRIAYMLTSLGIGGAEKQAVAISERMAARGHKVMLLVLRPPEEHEWPTKLPVYRLGIRKTIPSIVSGLFRARRVLRSFNPDLVHSHTFPANMMARTLRAISAAPDVLSTIHNIYEGGWHRTLAYRITDPFSNHTTTVSQAIADRHIQIKATPPRKISVLTNGIDTEIFDLSSVSKAQSLSNEFVWLAVGRDVPAKDFDTLLTAFQVVRAAAPHAQLRMAGRPSARRVDMTAAGVEWLGISDDMPRTLAACDAFVLGSAWEGMPLVVGEAMAMEKPVVATDVGGVQELVGDSGILIPPKHPQALADAMLRIMRMPESERSELGRTARLRIAQHFDINAKADEWESLYTGILLSRG